jgi:protein SCO1/2
MRARRRTLAALTTAALTLVAVVLILLLGGPAGRRASSLSDDSLSGFAGAALPAGVPERDFTLTDQAGRLVSLSGLHGQVTLLVFLATTCGAPCVLVAHQVRGALDELEHPPPVLVVSLDPAADTPARVARFLAQVSLTGRVRYLTGPARSLRPIWGAYRVHPPRSDRAAFQRSATVVLLDRHGRQRVIFGLEQLTPEGLAHDLRKLAASR